MYSCHERGFAMGRDNLPIKVSPNGRMSMPAKQRKALGLENGGMVVATVQDGELRIRTVKAVLDDALVAPALKASGDSADQLIADRRAEFAKEEQEYQDYLKQRRTWRSETVIARSVSDAAIPRIGGTGREIASSPSFSQ
jgi:AbrB family looped-hinge helix DNA binding protein